MKVTEKTIAALALIIVLVAAFYIYSCNNESRYNEEKQAQTEQQAIQTLRDSLTIEEVASIIEEVKVKQAAHAEGSAEYKERAAQLDNLDELLISKKIQQLDILEERMSELHNKIETYEYIQSPDPYTTIRLRSLNRELEETIKAYKSVHHIATN